MQISSSSLRAVAFLIAHATVAESGGVNGPIFFNLHPGDASSSCSPVPVQSHDNAWLIAVTFSHYGAKI